jgi:hypothetical protein
MRRRGRRLARAGSGVGAVFDQQSKNDHEQDDEKKPSFHGGECDIGGRQVNSGSSLSVFYEKCDAPATVSGRSFNGLRSAGQYEQTFTVRKR